MLKVYTAQYRYSGKDRLDITASGKTAFGRFFMPGWSLVKGLKNGTITEAEYEREYHAAMINSWHQNKYVWDKILELEQVTLVCFCPPGAFCHRILLAGYLEKLGAEYMGERDLTNGKIELTVLHMNILNVPNGIICHQVNCQGVMGAGIAKQIRDKWPHVYATYRKAFERGELRLGNVIISRTREGAWFPGEEPIVANLCGQDRYGRDKKYTDYIGLRKALQKLAKWREYHEDLTGSLLPIYFPHGMGCNNAGGDWYLVHCMIKDIFPDAIIG